MEIPQNTKTSTSYSEIPDLPLDNPKPFNLEDYNPRRKKKWFEYLVEIIRNDKILYSQKVWALNERMATSIVGNALASGKVKPSQPIVAGCVKATQIGSS